MISWTRRNDCIERMNFALREHRKLDFIWGQSDCGIIFSDVAWAMTDVDPMKIFGRWNSEHGALRALVSTGFVSVKDYLDAELEIIPVSEARRGDVGYPEDVTSLMCPAIITGAEAVSRNPDGWITVPRSQLVTAYRVG
ncbi:DUF6950 family protein [Hyphomicrobium sp. DY-1]|uniref:DUF6950 family protein n=1 Tax=Hyphomicrobium sp. DY-1 TaxID=3075650 RepID=UPI0039C42EF8